MSTRDEKYQTISGYCSKHECPKMSENRKGNCELENFCHEPVVAPRGFGKISRLPDILGMDLDVAYEIVKSK